MDKTRHAAVAGMFYPGDAQTLRQQINQFLTQAKTDQNTERCPKAIISPHAGYIYSGPIAASVYQRIGQHKNTIKRVVLLGPSHRVPLFGLATSTAEFFSTPLGNIPIDKLSVQKALSLPQVRVFDEAHSMEHSLEVQLPFLQTVLNNFSLVPFVVGDAPPEDVSEVLELLWGGDETLIVISSDLSHYHDYETARHMDRATSDAIEALAPEKIHYDDACGRHPVNGLLLSAKQHALKAKTIDLRNSGDTAGAKDQVVGYGAYVFENEY